MGEIACQTIDFRMHRLFDLEVAHVFLDHQKIPDILHDNASA